MADNTRVNELQDKFLKAMDILNAQALNSISFDKTITCKIENDKDKKDGKYEVNDGSKIFTAYSIDTRFRSGDTVYVTIPEGKFENQKMIIGKKTSETEKPFNFIQPFDTIFDKTGNIVQPVKGELVANDIETQNILIYENKEYNISNYTRLGIKANFKSWVKNAITGNYGLHILLTTKTNVTVAEIEELDKLISALDPDDIEQKEIYELQKQGISNSIITLDNSNMYGNPYNFETNYEQQIVVPLDEIEGTITSIQIQFYQDSNFYDKFNVKLPYKQDDILLPANLFVDNVYICFGYDLSTFTKDYVEIYTQNRNTYKRSTDANSVDANESLNKKLINMRWIHIDEDGNPIDMVAAADKWTDETRPKYEVRWYRYRVGAAAADPYCGVYWERMYVNEDNSLRLQTEEDKNTASPFGKTEEFIGLWFIPDVNKQQEKIKAIVIYKENIPYRSNELIFENEEQLPPSQEAQHIMTALNIECNDGTNGNYLIYGQNRDIKDTKYGDEERTLSLWFDADNNGQYTDNEEIQYNSNENIIWTFPANNTMIKLLNSGNNKTEVKDINGNIISYVLTNEIPKYQIKKSYNTSQNNNTISCQYILNNVVYHTEKVLTFGIAGTMGSEQTLVVDFLNDTNAIDLNNKNIQTYQIKVQLYDTSGQEITELNNITWSWWKKTHDYLTLSNINSSICNLRVNHNNIAHGQLYILKVEVGNLETYFSIPLKSSDRCDYIEGPTEVIYQSNGEPDFYNYPYKIYNDGVEVKENVEWGIISTDTNNINPGNYDAIIQNKKLNPIKVYVKDAPFYGVKGGYNIDKNNEQIFWTQPIIVIQNKWPSNVINKWDGKTIEIDNGNGTILTQALAAGTKNSRNEFSGVMIGEWKHTDSDNISFDQTGVYGFHEGAMSYAFKEDGTAFLGENGKGRINFDGNNATIYSPFYETQGMKIDLNDASIVMKYNSNTIKIDAGADGSITNANDSNAPFKIGSRFAVDWDGTIYAKNGNFEGTITGSTLQSPYGNDGAITLNGVLKVGKGYLGEILSDLPGIGEKYAGGIGLSAGDLNSVSVIKATQANVGMRYKTAYITAANTGELTDGTKINEFIGIGGNYLVCTIDAENQYGIYARFA